MSNEEMLPVAAVAMAFRHAIERCRPTLTYIAFKDFPFGSCGDASDVLGRFLSENGSPGWIYVCGNRDDRTHAWLEKEGVSADITADQFEDAPRPVIVALDSAWHENFAIDSRRPIWEDWTLSSTARELQEAYRKILDSLKQDEEIQTVLDKMRKRTRKNVSPVEGVIACLGNTAQEHSRAARDSEEIDDGCIRRLALAVEALLLSANATKGLEMAFIAMLPLVEDDFPTWSLLKQYHDIRDTLALYSHGSYDLRDLSYSEQIRFDRIGGRAKHLLKKAIWKLFLNCSGHNRRHRAFRVGVSVHNNP